MASSCWTRVVSFFRREQEITSLRRRLRRIKKEAASDGEAIKHLVERVVSLERALAAAALEWEATEARKREAERRADEAEAALEAATRYAELSVGEAREKKVEIEEKGGRILELEREMASRFDDSRW